MNQTKKYRCKKNVMNLKFVKVVAIQVYNEVSKTSTVLES